METTIEWLKEKFGISDEAIAAKQAEEAHEADAAAEQERAERAAKEQSLRDQIANKDAEIQTRTDERAALQAELDGLGNEAQG
jgi:hypothetical protein